MPSYTINATPIYFSPVLPEGKIICTGDGTPGGLLSIFVGTGITPLEAEGRKARQIVRDGLADVLEWLGEPVRLQTPAERLMDQLRDSQASRARKVRPGSVGRPVDLGKL